MSGRSNFVNSAERCEKHGFIKTSVFFSFFFGLFVAKWSFCDVFKFIEVCDTHGC